MSRINQVRLFCVCRRDPVAPPSNFCSAGRRLAFRPRGGMPAFRGLLAGVSLGAHSGPFPTKDAARASHDLRTCHGRSGIARQPRRSSPPLAKPGRKRSQRSGKRLLSAPDAKPGQGPGGHETSPDIGCYGARHRFLASLVAITLAAGLILLAVDIFLMAISWPLPSGQAFRGVAFPILLGGALAPTYVPYVLAARIELAQCIGHIFEKILLTCASTD